jgi:hypothetical protein
MKFCLEKERRKMEGCGRAIRKDLLSKQEDGEIWKLNLKDVQYKDTHSKQKVRCGKIIKKDG